MCIVIDYADPSSGNPLKKIKCWGLQEHKTRRWLDSDEERKVVRKPLKKRQIRKKRPPNKKSSPLTVPTPFAKRGKNKAGREKREERRGILVGQVALGETMPIMLFFDL